MFLERKPDATISFTDIVQLMGGGTPKTEEDSFGMVIFFSLHLKMFLIHRFALVPKNT